MIPTLDEHTVYFFKWNVTPPGGVSCFLFSLAARCRVVETRSLRQLHSTPLGVRTDVMLDGDVGVERWVIKHQLV